MEGLKIIDTGKVGPTTLVVGLVHGNEIVGKQVLDFIEENNKQFFKVGKIILLEGNPRAFEQKVRFIDQDLNRSFGDLISDTIEAQRAREIKNYFENSNMKIDYVFDFHSTVSESDPMTICTTNDISLNLVDFFPIKKVILGLVDIIEGISLTKYFSLKGAIDLAFECGFHNNKNTINIAIRIIKIISEIHNHKIVSYKMSHEKILIKRVIKTSDKGFRFIKKFEGFEKIRKGEIFAKEFNSDVMSDDDFVIVLPNLVNLKNLKIFDEVVVGYLGKVI